MFYGNFAVESVTSLQIIKQIHREKTSHVHDKCQIWTLSSKAIGYTVIFVACGKNERDA